MPSDGVFSLFWLVAGVIIVGSTLVIGHLIVQTVRNYRSPQLCWPARIVAKRQHVSGTSDGPTSTTYYVTFQTEDGQRHEYRVKAGIFGKLVEGDEGTVRAQGTWFLGFARRR